MIASPGDVAEERDVIRGVIHDWNDVNAEHTNTLLSAVGWDTHSSPELGARAQDLINTRVLKNCDLLIGVFWTRLGTPTGNSPSGTVEEIEEHIQVGKPAMIYFSSKPVAPESIDSAQYAKVKEFQSKLKDRGIIETYNNIQDFKYKLSKQMQLCLVNNQYLRGLVASPSSSGAVGTPGVSVRGLSIDFNLTDEAKELLKAAATDERGTIIKAAYIGGRVIQAGGKSFGGERGRDSAKWEAALDELESTHLVVGRGEKGQIYELTHRGWEVADAL
ncbi:DUF4062 domain-containing protein [Rhodanobacter sp. UC4450_H17]